MQRNVDVAETKGATNSNRSWEFSDCLISPAQQFLAYDRCFQPAKHIPGFVPICVLHPDYLRYGHDGFTWRITMDTTKLAMKVQDLFAKNIDATQVTQLDDEFVLYVTLHNAA
jgi:hypothetical protein